MEIDAYQRLLAMQEQTKPRKRASHRESDLQQHCHRWFNNSYKECLGLYFSIPNGAHVSPSQARILKAEGLTKGVADTFLAVPRDKCHGLFIEFKKETLVFEDGKKPKKKRTYQEPEQKEWQEKVEERGYRYEIVRTFEEFVKLIEEYMG